MLRDINEDMNIAVVIAIKKLQEFQVLQRVSAGRECLSDNAALGYSFGYSMPEAEQTTASRVFPVELY